VFGTTPEPLLGANPPKPTKRPPLDGKVPCETQATPDLRTQTAPPPPQREVNTSTPAFQARYAKARDEAVQWLQKQLKIEDLTKLLKVSDKDATPQVIDKVAKGATP
jgi:hypothetical protein